MVLDDARKLSKTEALTKVKQLRREFTAFYDALRVFSTKEVVDELMAFRGYTSPDMYQTLLEIGVTKISSLGEIELVAPLSSYKTSSNWGLLDKNGRYLLTGRYVVPIRDISGDVTALVGWFPDDRKYVTTPTFGFSKDAQFFNIEQYSAASGYTFLVEGIFDTISLRSLGYTALGNMGLGLSPIKREILKRFGHVCAIPDGDKAGQSVLPYKSERNAYKWGIEQNVTFIELDVPDVKDVDDLIKLYDCKEDLDRAVNSTSYRLKFKC